MAKPGKGFMKLRIARKSDIVFGRKLFTVAIDDEANLMRETLLPVTCDKPEIVDGMIYVRPYCNGSRGDALLKYPIAQFPFVFGRLLFLVEEGEPPSFSFGAHALFVM